MTVGEQSLDLRPTRGGIAALRALRPHQWSKNLLVFVPAVAGHRFTLEVFGLSAVAFVCFCAAASSGYLVNDVLDAEADRGHARKASRPVAAGQLSARIATLVAAGLAVVALALAAGFSGALAGIVLIYLLLTFAYSLVLKGQAIVDVIILAGLFTLRVIGGSAVTGIAASKWLLMFSLFLFLCLSLAKRCSETAGVSGNEAIARRGYTARDLPALVSMGVSAGYAACLVLAIYVGSPEVRLLYAHVERLWFALPLLIYWVSRVMLLASRGDLHEDPVIFAVGDRLTWLVGAGLAAVFALSI
jgi:4-hydroxybenzoate polyprenyltransferase